MKIPSKTAVDCVNFTDGTVHEDASINALKKKLLIQKDKCRKSQGKSRKPIGIELKLFLESYKLQK